MSETKYLKLFKHDNPPTNKNKFDVQKALNNNWDKIDEAIGDINTKNGTYDTDLKAIKEKNTAQDTRLDTIEKEQVTQNTELEELRAENERLRNDINSLPTASNTGENIVIEGSAEARFKKIGIEGNSKQQTSSQGKNMLDPQKFIKTTTVKELTFTNNGDDTFNISGTTTGSVSLSIMPLKGLIKKNTKYYLYCSEAYNSTTFNLSIPVKLSDGTTQYIQANTAIAVQTKDLDIADCNLVFYAPEGAQINASNVKVMLVESDVVDNDYEAFVPDRPSLEYPSETKEVGNNINIAKINETDWNITKDNTIKNKAGNNSKILTEITLKKGEKVTFSFKLLSRPTTNTSFTCKIDGTSNSNCNYANFNVETLFRLGTTYTKTYTAENDCTVSFTSYGNSNSDIFEFQFWANYGEGKTYAPYNMGAINEKIGNANLLDLTKMRPSEIRGNVTYEIKSPNEIIVTNNEKTDTNPQYLRLTKKLPPNKYYAQCKMEILEGASATRTPFFQIANTNFAGTIANIRYDNQVTVPFTVVEQDNAGIILGFIMTETGEATTPRKVRFYDIMISTKQDAEYVPHEEQEYMLSIQKPMLKGDSISDKEYHTWEKRILNGTENWLSGSSAPNQVNTMHTAFNIDRKEDIQANIIYIKSDNYKSDTGNNVFNKDIEAIGRSKSQIVLRINKDRASTVAELKEYLKEHPITVYIKKAQIEELDLTENQKAEIEKINKEAHAYKGITHIYTEDEVAPIIKEEHIIDIESYINSKLTKANEPMQELPSAMPSEQPSIESDIGGEE